MTVAAILLALIIGVGLVLYIHNRLTTPADNDEVAETQPADGQPAENAGDDSGECCGLHITCEKDSLVAGLDRELLYYDDEELDAYRGRPADGYTDSEIEEFREVLLTLRPDDIAGWARSITARGITLPTEVRDELLLIVAEARNRKSKTDNDREGRADGTA